MVGKDGDGLLDIGKVEMRYIVHYGGGNRGVGTYVVTVVIVVVMVG